MIFVWIFVLIGLLMLSITYFIFTDSIMQIFNLLVAYGLPEWCIDVIMKYYHMAFIILAVGILLYGIIASTKEEPDSYVI